MDGKVLAVMLAVVVEFAFTPLEARESQYIPLSECVWQLAVNKTSRDGFGQWFFAPKQENSAARNLGTLRSRGTLI